MLPAAMFRYHTRLKGAVSAGHADSFSSSILADTCSHRLQMSHTAGSIGLLVTLL